MFGIILGSCDLEGRAYKIQNSRKRWANYSSPQRKNLWESEKLFPVIHLNCNASGAQTERTKNHVETLCLRLWSQRKDSGPFLWCQKSGSSSDAVFDVGDTSRSVGPGAPWWTECPVERSNGRSDPGEPSWTGLQPQRCQICWFSNGHLKWNF